MENKPHTFKRIQINPNDFHYIPAVVHLVNVGHVSGPPMKYAPKTLTEAENEDLEYKKSIEGVCLYIENLEQTAQNTFDKLPKEEWNEELIRCREGRPTTIKREISAYVINIGDARKMCRSLITALSLTGDRVSMKISDMIPEIIRDIQIEDSANDTSM